MESMTDNRGLSLDADDNPTPILIFKLIQGRPPETLILKNTAASIISAPACMLL